MDLLLTYNEPLLTASYHKFKAFSEWILTFLGESKGSTLSHPIAISLIEHFSNVFPEDILAGLPLKRAIQHHIDLIPKAILPNKLASRMNPKETMEVQR